MLGQAYVTIEEDEDFYIYEELITETGRGDPLLEEGDDTYMLLKSVDDK